MYKKTNDENIVQHVGSGAFIPKNNKLWKKYQQWVEEGNTADEPDPPQEAPTKDELYDEIMQNQKLLKAVVLAINDGSFVPGENLSGQELKSIIKSKMG